MFYCKLYMSCAPNYMYVNANGHLFIRLSVLLMSYA